MQAHREWGSGPQLRNRGSAPAPKTSCCPVCFTVQDAVLAAQTSTPASRRAAYLDDCPGRPEGAPGPRGAERGWGAFPSQGPSAKSRPSLLRGPRIRQAFTRLKVLSGAGGQKGSSPQPPGKQVTLSGSPPPCVTPRVSRGAAAPTTYALASRRREANAKSRGCPVLTGFQRWLQTLPSRRLRLQTHPSKSDSNNLHVRPPGRNDTPSPSRPPKRRTNPLILHENTRVTNHTV